MSPQPGFQFNLKTGLAQKQVQEAILKSVADTFELDIKPEAAKNTPVLSGTNRRSIDTEISLVPEGIKAELFTQSGYGGYLEIGTKKMQARPYLLPAFNLFRRLLTERIARHIANFRKK